MNHFTWFHRICAKGTLLYLIFYVLPILHRSSSCLLGQLETESQISRAEKQDDVLLGHGLRMLIREHTATQPTHGHKVTKILMSLFSNGPNASPSNMMLLSLFN